MSKTQTARRILPLLSQAGQHTRNVIASPSVNTARQVINSILITLLWLGLIPLYVNLVSPYSTFTSARTMAVGLAVFAAIAPHVWPSKTPPWRTSAWALVTTAFIGSTLLLLGADRYGLMITTIVGMGIVALRANQNGRRLAHLIRTYRATR